MFRCKTFHVTHAEIISSFISGQILKKIGTPCQRLQTKPAVLLQGSIISIFLQGGIYLLLTGSWFDISATPLLLSSDHAAHKENEVWLLDPVSR